MKIGDVSVIKERKEDHIELCCNAAVEFRAKTTLLEEIDLIHDSMPELSLEEVDISTKFLGRSLKAPLIITAMTGGTQEAKRINKDIATVAQRYSIGFGLGSQRAMYENPDLTETYQVRDVAPDILLLGNIGLSQVKDMKIEEVDGLAKDVDADVMCIHLNSAMELVQQGGDTDFNHGYETFKRLKEGSSCKIMAKETGSGISRKVGLALKDIGIESVDVSGAGGTSWVAVEALRNTGLDKDLGNLYWDWGIPTAASICELADLNFKLIASGGIRSGLDIAKSLVLGAQVAGVALPVLRAHHSNGQMGVARYIQELIMGLKMALVLTGSRNLEDLKRQEPILNGKLKEWLGARGLQARRLKSLDERRRIPRLCSGQARDEEPSYAKASQGRRETKDEIVYCPSERSERSSLVPRNVSKSSKISGFYKLPLTERLKTVKRFAGLTEEEVKVFVDTGGFGPEQADRMIENVIGTYSLGLGIAVNFLINGKDYLIPMVIEEPSVIAAASFAAKLTRVNGGIKAASSGPIMIGQVQVVDIANPNGAMADILAAKERIIKLANQQDPILKGLGGGLKDLEVKILEDTIKGPMVIVHLLVDTKDAMGANAVNTMAEAVAPLIEEITQGQVRLKILSNLADKRLVRAEAVVRKEALATETLAGEEVLERILEAYAFAAADPYRAATHNKGIMNGMDAVILATGNDWRAVEAGAHAYASRSGRYQPLTAWEKDRDGNLKGTIETPMAVGLVGGATKVHPVARVAIKILGVTTAAELGEVIAAVGLAQNFAALRALATEGIQRGHMSLHARNISVAAGASGEQIVWVAEQMVSEGKIRLDRAKEILNNC